MNNIKVNKMDQENKLSEIRKIEGALEAILFAAGHPVSYEKIGEALELTPGDAKRIAEHLAEKYNNNTDGGIMMLLFPDTCQLCSREDYIPYVRIALGIRRGGNLSNSALEVLAIVAYNQPVTRSFIDTVRGVDSAYAVGSLLDKELIEPCGKLFDLFQGFDIVLCRKRVGFHAFYRVVLVAACAKHAEKDLHMVSDSMIVAFAACREDERTLFGPQIQRLI